MGPLSDPVTFRFLRLSGGPPFFGVLPLQSILDRDRWTGLPIAQRSDLNAAERAAHESGLQLHRYLSIYLPPELRDKTLDVTVVGLFSALARLIAEHRDPALAAAIATGLGAVLPKEVAAWQAKMTEAAHVH